MATNVSIIEIDLGEIEKIISEDIAEISGNAREKLDQSINERKAIERVKQERNKIKEAANSKLSNMLESTYDKLLASGNEGVPVSEILADVNELITTPSAFTLRMKTLLKEKGNPFIIKRITVAKIPRYILETFNGQD